MNWNAEHFLRNVRLNGWTQSEVGDACGLTRNQLHAAVYGTRPCRHLPQRRAALLEFIRSEGVSSKAVLLTLIANLENRQHLVVRYTRVLLGFSLREWSRRHGKDVCFWSLWERGDFSSGRLSTETVRSVNRDRCVAIQMLQKEVKAR